MNNSENMSSATAEVMGIPSLDLHDFTQGSEQQRSDFISHLGNAYEEIGFVAVKNHGIATDFLKEFYEQVEAFFNLDTEQKEQYTHPSMQRGYIGHGKEHAKNSNKGDLKEFWHFGQYTREGDELHSFYPKNITCEEIPRFNEIGKQAFLKLEEAGVQMLRAIALYLNLEETYFDDKVRGGNSILRPIHYPPILSEPDGSVRAGEHEDINLITLLVGASADGLQVLNKKNEWISITALPDHIVVNVGDMLQRLTNDRLRSTTHRVVNPPREAWGESRFSIPFFLHPKPHVPLNCLASCITNETPKKYEDITANAYLLERLREIGLLK